MSYDLNAYVREAALPSVSMFRDSLAAKKIVITELEDLLELDGFVEATLDGAQTGFELLLKQITDEDRDRYRGRLEKKGKPPDEHLEILTGSDYNFMFTCAADDPKEIETTRAVAETLAALSHGWLFDPQQGGVRSFRGG